MIKRAKFAALFLALALLLSACGGDAGGGEEERVVRVGVLGGDDARAVLGIRYANQETPAVTIGGKEYTVVLAGAEEEGVSVVLDARGPGASGEDVAVLGEAGVPVIGVLCTDPGESAGGDYYFRICFPDSLQGAALAAFAAGRLSAKTAYCLGENGSAYDQDMIASFSRAFEAGGGKVTAGLFPPGAEDFSFYLNQAGDGGADLVLLPASVIYAAQILSQAGTLGVTVPFLGPDALDGDRLPGVVKGRGLRLYVSAAYQEGGNAGFDEGFKEYLGSDEEAMNANGGSDTVSAAAAMGYDAYRVALEAMKRAGSADKADLMAVLPGVACQGVSGDLAFDDSGDALRNTVFIKAADSARGVWSTEPVRVAGS